MSKLEEVCERVLALITPSEEERERVMGLAREVMNRLRAVLREEGVDGEVRLEGSLAKDTWLSGEADVDIFVRFKPDVSRDFFRKRFLELAREATKGFKHVERFAEHPYLECLAGDVRVNIVPCYAVEPGGWLSATDRTPYHTQYVLSRLDERLRAAIRLLKKFMKGIGAYGAEIKVGGFSGYLCELLAIYYGGFREVLEGALRWRKGVLIDPANHYRGREGEAREFFRHHLIVVDPVDPARNAAASVRLDKMCIFMAAAKAFLERPSEGFFFPRGPEEKGIDELRREIEGRGTSILAIHVEPGRVVPDVLWGQAFRTLRALRGLLKNEGFRVLRSTAWSDEREHLVLLLELEASELPPVIRHLGPPVWAGEHVERFLSKQLANPGLVSGPYVEGDRWVALVRRRWRRASDLIEAKLGDDGGRSVGVAPLLAEKIKEHFEVLEGTRILALCRELREFKRFLVEFLRGRPSWLAPEA